MFLRPRWLASHLFAIVLVVAFIFAGFWQINRLGQRQSQNEIAASRMDSAVSFDDILDSPTNELEFRRVQVEGRFEPGSEVLIANRSRDGAAGFWVWTNFVTEHGDLLVSRGFVNRGTIVGGDGAPPRSEAAVNDEPLLIEGLTRTGFDSARVSSDETQLTRPDPARAGELLELDTALDSSVYLSLIAQEPLRAQEIPFPVPLPDLSEGPHRSYAFQWFTFAVIGTIGYSVLLYRISRGNQERGDVPI